MAITISSLIMTRYFSGTIEAITKCKKVLSLKALNDNGCFLFEQFMKVMERVLFAAFTCILALGMLHFASLLLVYISICFCYIILYISLFRHIKSLKNSVLWTLGGSIIGTVAGGIKGQTTEVGFLDGAGKGAIAGAIAAIELMSFAYVAVGEPFSKVTILTVIYVTTD